jgi:hypothetical protein
LAKSEGCAVPDTELDAFSPEPPMARACSARISANTCWICMLLMVQAVTY